MITALSSGRDEGGQISMTEQIILAGFGGQGVLLAGQIIAYAGMNEGKNVSWLLIVLWTGNARRYSQL